MRPETETAPDFSIIVPCYNAEATLEATVRSALNQSHRDFELLLIDDGSRDGTLALGHKLAQGDGRIRVFSRPNGGVSSARNFGLAQARGCWIAFLDADDIWLPQKLERHAELFRERADISVSFARIRFLEPDATPTKVTSCPRLSGIDAVLLLAENVTCTTSNLVVRRKVFDRVGGFDEALHFDEDKEWLFRAHAAGEGFAGIPVVLTGYRTSPGGLASDLGHMERDWERYVAKAAEHAPEAVAKATPRARALFLRNLSRRSMRLGLPGTTSLRLFLRAVVSAPGATLSEPRRWLQTGAAALTVAVLPRGLALSLMARLDRVAARRDTAELRQGELHA